MDRTVSGATTPGQNGPGTDGKEGVLHITTGASLSEYLVLYPGHSLGVSYPSVEMKLVNSTAPVD